MKRVERLTLGLHEADSARHQKGFGSFIGSASILLGKHPRKCCLPSCHGVLSCCRAILPFSKPQDCDVCSQLGTLTRKTRRSRLTSRAVNTSISFSPKQPVNSKTSSPTCHRFYLCFMIPDWSHLHNRTSTAILKAVSHGQETVVDSANIARPVLGSVLEDTSAGVAAIPAVGHHQPFGGGSNSSFVATTATDPTGDGVNGGTGSFAIITGPQGSTFRIAFKFGVVRSGRFKLLLGTEVNSSQPPAP